MKHILLFLLDGYADWESGFASAKLNKPDLGYKVHTISLTQSVTSQGNFSTNIEYLLDTFQDFQNLAALLLIGGTGWGNQHLIKGYSPTLYDTASSQKITTFIDRCLTCQNVLVAAICDGTTFLADNRYLDKIAHTGNSLAHLKGKAPAYQGECLFQEKQAVASDRIITANGTAPLEFTREILIALNMLGTKEKADAWFTLYKHGSFES